MGKEDIKFMKLEEINKEDYPKELKEQGARSNNSISLMSNAYKGSIYRVFPTWNFGGVVRTNHFDDQESESNISATDKNLPGVPPQLNLELPFKLIDEVPFNFRDKWTN
ncbi:hypothetical protein OIU78_025076 [Salix suchowensis]|nr:hypothetical protein OIU78_025076 [Salix suchowensis]